MTPTLLFGYVLAVIMLLSLGAGAAFLYMRWYMHRKLDAQKTRIENEQFNKMTEMKQQFFMNLSNELRVPISNIIMPLQGLVNEPLPVDTRLRLQAVLKDAQAFLHQVNMMLNLRPLGDGTSFFPSAPETTTAQVIYEPLSTQRNLTDTDRREQPTDKTNTIKRTMTSENAVVDDTNAAEVADLTEEAHNDETTSHRRFTMLMVDDSTDMCRFVRDYFRGVYNVLTAHDGEQALKFLEENEDIDLVVSDVTMPRMDGMELCRRIKSDLHSSHIPVILLTGRRSDDMEMMGLKLGADDYITKPFNVEMLRLRVKNLIEKQKNRQRLFREKDDVAANEITITTVDEMFIQKATKICEDHMADTEFSVEALGHELSMSRTYLYKKLMNITGRGPAEFIRTIRMKKGKQLLEQGVKQIAEIATELGYNSSKRFSENFKAEYGMAPSEYIRRLKEKTR